MKSCEPRIIAQRYRSLLLRRRTQWLYIVRNRSGYHLHLLLLLTVTHFTSAGCQNSNDELANEYIDRTLLAMVDVQVLEEQNHDLHRLLALATVGELVGRRSNEFSALLNSQKPFGGGQKTIVTFSRFRLNRTPDCPRASFPTVSDTLYLLLY